jgi:hypothetical protein
MLTDQSLSDAVITAYDKDFKGTFIVCTGAADANGNHDMILS